MIIAHIDMDSFFASIEERENPQFRELGIAVGADPRNGTGRGVVSTANYQARKYGIHSAMPITTAWRFAKSAEEKGHPKTVFLPVNMPLYNRVSDKIMEIVRKYVPVIEQTSIDEAYLNLSFCLSGNQSNNFMTNTSDHLHLSSEVIDRGYGRAFELIKNIKKEIKLSESLTAKGGIGPNKLIAKMASSSCPPDRLIVIKPHEVEKFLEPLPIGDIPGIGPKTEEFFHRKNIYKISHLKQITKPQLQGWMGKRGGDIYQKARGIDDSIVSSVREIKSISEQETFEKDTLSASFILDRLNKLAESVIVRMKDEGISGFQTITIVVRFSDFTTKSKSHTLPNGTSNLAVLKREAVKMMLPFLDRRGNFRLQLIRLIGVGIEKFG